MSFSKPKFQEAQTPPPPPFTPTRADASVVTAGESVQALGSQSFISTGSSGLNRKANSKKRSLIGGS